MSQIIYRATTHGFYSDLVGLLGSICSYLFTVHSITSKELPTIIVDPKFPLQLESYVTDRSYIFHPRELLFALAIDAVPDQLVLIPGRANLSKPADHRLSSTSHKKLVRSIMESAFLKYFENQRTQVEHNYGQNVESWPPVWNFGRVVRNAFGHQGKITFSNPKSASVEWRGISYQPSDNGREVLLVDMAICDLIFLMDDMNAAL